MESVGFGVEFLVLGLIGDTCKAAFAFIDLRLKGVCKVEKEWGRERERERDGKFMNDVSVVVKQNSPQENNNDDKHCHKDHKCNHAHHNANNRTSR